MENRIILAYELTSQGEGQQEEYRTAEDSSGGKSNVPRSNAKQEVILFEQAPEKLWEEGKLT